MTTITMFAPVGSGGSLELQYSGTVFVKSNGTVSVDARDAGFLLNVGYQFANVKHDVYTTPCIPGAANATVTVASVSVTPGANSTTTLTVAAQPIVARPLAAVFDPGTVAVTAGVLQLTYTGNDGASHVDSLSLVTAASTVLTVTTSYGVEHLTSALIVGLTGGIGWLRGIGTNANLAVPLPPRAVSVSFTKETIISTAVTTGITTGVDESVGATVGTDVGIITPTTAPNASQMLSFGYNYTYPG